MKTNSQRILNIVSALSMLTLVGCSTWSLFYSKPRVELVNVEVSSFHGTNLVLEAEFAIDNSNSSEIEITHLEYDLTVSGQKLSHLSEDKKITITAKGRSMAKIPIAVDLKEVMGSLFKIIRTKKMEYELHGEIKAGLLTVPFQKAGQVDLADIH